MNHSILMTGFAGETLQGEEEEGPAWRAFLKRSQAQLSGGT
jgi:hypothetical protein